MVWDLLQSERGYVRILNIIVQIYYRPLCQRVQESKSFLFSEKLIRCRTSPPQSFIKSRTRHLPKLSPGVPLLCND